MSIIMLKINYYKNKIDCNKRFSNRASSLFFPSLRFFSTERQLAPSWQAEEEIDRRGRRLRSVLISVLDETPHTVDSSLGPYLSCNTIQNCKP